MGLEVEIKEHGRKKKNRLEIPNEENRHHDDFSYEAQRKKSIYRNLTGVVGILLILYTVLWSYQK